MSVSVYFVASTVHALGYYSAVSKSLVLDNLCADITKHTKDEEILNSAYRDPKQFCKAIILPAPAQNPKGSTTVAKGVQWLESHLMEDLKEHIHFTTDVLNKNIQRIVDSSNDRINQEQRFSRREAFESYDNPSCIL